jgi:4-amino-4-deoxy-L-arabinose transferase-like glycosyltransferase
MKGNTDLALTLPKKQAILFRNIAVVYLILYAAIKIAFAFSGVNLFTEEAQYWVWSRYPDWSYYSKPPLIAWINLLTGAIAHHESAIRLTALAFGLGTLFMAYKVSNLLFSDIRIAYLSAFFLSVSPFFMLASTFFTTDSPLLVFWSVTAFFFIRAVMNNVFKDWILAGCFFGLGCLSKYSMIFFLFAFTPIIFIRGHTKYLTGIIAFFMVAAVLFTPVVYWNYQHDWVTFKHVGWLAGGTSGVFNLKRSLAFVGEYMGGFILITSPFMLYLVYRFRGTLRGVSTEGLEERRRLAWLAIPLAGTAAVFLLISMFKRTEVNWGAMSYFSLPIVLAYLVVKNEGYLSGFSAAGVTLLLLILLLFPRAWDRVGYPGLVPLKFDSMKRMAGWESLAIKVSAVQREYPDAPVILTDDYHVASAVAFYGEMDKVYCLNLGRRMNQYDLWRLREGFDNAAPRAVYVTELSSVLDGINCDAVESKVTFPVLYRGRVIRKFNIFVLKNFRLSKADHFDAY